MGRKRIARDPEERENQLINLAINLAERQLEDGSATSQVIVHFLKLATTREKLENERLRSDLRVADAKIKQISMQENLVELYSNAIKAMNEYSGNAPIEKEDCDYG